MMSKLLGRIDLQHYLLNNDIQKILSFSGHNTQYSEFVAGDWKTYVLWNSNGSDDNGLVIACNSAAQPTQRGKTLSGILALIEDVFNIELLRLVRVHSLGEGVLIPHRDFVELDDPAGAWTRIHIPIQINAYCFHAENDSVFRMRQGEIWFFDASKTHSACNFGSDRRLNLCLDFDLGNRDISVIFRNKCYQIGNTIPVVVNRPELTATHMEGIYSLSSIISKNNYKDIISILTKLVFDFNVDIRSFYTWLTEISEMSGDQSIFEKTKSFVRFLSIHRVINERFVL